MDGIRKATVADAVALAARLGYGDALEVYAMGRDPTKVLIDMVKYSKECWVAVVKGRVEVIFGVAAGTALSDYYSPFLLGSDSIPALRFFKEVKSVISDWKERYENLLGIVDSRNLRAQRWLKWAGFEFGETIYAGPGRRPFRTIHMGYGVTQPYRSTG